MSARRRAQVRACAGSPRLLYWSRQAVDGRDRGREDDASRILPSNGAYESDVMLMDGFTRTEIETSGARQVAEIASSHYSRQYHYMVERSMEEAISAADANRRFSLLLRGVREGRSYVVTSHGKPVARLIPAGRHEDVANGARAALLSRLKKQPAARAKPWTRDELYEDER